MATDPSPPTFNPTSVPPIATVLTVILIVFFLLGFFFICFCRCFLQDVTDTLQIQRTPSGNVIGAAAKTGLDPSLIQSFPTFLYSSVKDFHKEEYGLECAICLLEFEDDSLLRLLAVCYHVFHQECIDLWLESHKTCPVCRRDLDLPPDSLDKYSKELIYNHNHMHDSHHKNNNEPLEDVVRIDINEDEHGGESQDEHALKRKQMDEDKKVEIIARSHTTGHSIVKTRGEEDCVARYTLRLPEHVKGCPYGENCTFLYDEQSKNRESVVISLGLGRYGGAAATPVSGLNAKRSNWKTRICNKWELIGYCPFGSKCHFAHGVAELRRYGGGLVEGETRDSSSALPDSKQGGVPSKTLADSVVASVASVPHSDVYHMGVPSQRSSNVIQKPGQRTQQKWKVPDKISRIYGDWIDDIE